MKHQPAWNPLAKYMRRHPFRRQEKSAFDLPRSWILGVTEYVRQKDTLQDVERYCMFVGYPRSGHTLVASLLNAHPEMVIAHEVNVLRYLRYGFPKAALYGLILRRDRIFGEHSRQWSGYDYRVPGQFQGTVERLRVIGDKRGRASAHEIGRNPLILRRLKEKIGIPLRVIHHVRNPFDNIATIARKARCSLDDAATRYFRFVKWVQTGLAELDSEEVIHSHHEDLIADPAGEMNRLVVALGLSADAEYLEACAELVYPKPRKSRAEHDWSPALVDDIHSRIAQIPYLARYRFTD